MSKHLEERIASLEAEISILGNHSDYIAQLEARVEALEKPKMITLVSDNGEYKIDLMVNDKGAGIWCTSKDGLMTANYVGFFEHGAVVGVEGDVSHMRGFEMALVANKNDFARIQSLDKAGNPITH